MEKADCKSKLKELRCCILVPTYNNEKTLARVLDGVLDYADDLIVVCDGATDSTPEILKNYEDRAHILSYQPNKGKGNALRTGFKKAVELGFDYVISIDSDGQHYPENIPNFVTKLEENPGSLIIGARNMNQDSVPGKSSFGNKFSNFWFQFETGIKLPDTQSGYRLYPVKALDKVRFFTTKFEFEIEVIVKAAWRNIPVIPVPIKVLYDPDERVTHFRPFRDFTRISILNTYLVTLALLYYKPRNLLKHFQKKSLRQLIKEDLIQSHEPIHKKVKAVMLGVFIGVLPIWGLHTLSVIVLAHVFKLNKFIAFLASNISFPPLVPILVFLSMIIGKWVLGTGKVIVFNMDITVESIKDHLVQYAVGSTILAPILALLFGLLTFVYLSSTRTQKHG